MVGEGESHERDLTLIGRDSHVRMAYSCYCVREID